MTRITMFEIFTNPSDLEIIITQGSGETKFSFMISRGPGHGFKPLLNSRAIFDTPEVAIDIIKITLEAVIDNGRDFIIDEIPRLQKQSSDDSEINQSTVLNEEWVTKILDALRQHRIARTYKMLTTTN